MVARRSGQTATLLLRWQGARSGRLLPRRRKADWSRPNCTTPSAGPGRPPGTWSRPTHWRLSATVLPDGKVLVAGGVLSTHRRALASAELYDPGTGTWTARQTWTRHAPSYSHVAARRHGARGGGAAAAASATASHWPRPRCTTRAAEIEVTRPICETISGSQGRFGRGRAVASILDGHPSKRIADKCARLYRASTLVALRRGRETYETAALPLSYVGADQE